MNIILEFCRDFLLRTEITTGAILIVILCVIVGAMIGAEIGAYIGSVIGACFIVTALDYLL